MFDVTDYVVRKGTTHPIGVVVNAYSETAEVLWGVQDKKEFKERIPINELENFRGDISGVNDVILREIEKD